MTIAIIRELADQEERERAPDTAAELRRVADFLEAEQKKAAPEGGTSQNTAPLL